MGLIGCQQLKIKTAIISVAGVILIISIILILKLALFVHRISADTGTTTPEAIRLVTQVEGLEKINNDARSIFARIGTNTSRPFVPFPESDFTNFATISDLSKQLGEYSQVVIVGQDEVPTFPPMIRIRFGSHFHLKFLYILDPAKPFDISQVTNTGSHYILIGTNMFIYHDD